MSVDRKYTRKDSRKHRFHGNRFTNRNEMDLDKCSHYSVASPVALDENVNSSDLESTPIVKQKATPTRSEIKTFEFV